MKKFIIDENLKNSVLMVLQESVNPKLSWSQLTMLIQAVRDLPESIDKKQEKETNSKQKTKKKPGGDTTKGN